MPGLFRLESYKKKEFMCIILLAKQKDILDQGKESLTLS